VQRLHTGATLTSINSGPGDYTGVERQPAVEPDEATFPFAASALGTAPDLAFPVPKK
jgi:hypothetical protein